MTGSCWEGGWGRNSHEIAIRCCRPRLGRWEGGVTSEATASSVVVYSTSCPANGVTEIDEHATASSRFVSPAVSICPRGDMIDRVLAAGVAREDDDDGCAKSHGGWRAVTSWVTRHRHRPTPVPWPTAG
ncbi:hypothetical protein J6590_029649 [Homalodisca vitripennis]|nr:hypothetical protein J6590_029649 [Homalodisca vitripennis]